MPDKDFDINSVNRDIIDKVIAEQKTKDDRRISAPVRVEANPKRKKKQAELNLFKKK